MLPLSTSGRDGVNRDDPPHKGFMIGTFLGLAGAGLGALAPGRALYRLLLA